MKAVIIFFCFISFLIGCNKNKKVQQQEEIMIINAKSGLNLRLEPIIDSKIIEIIPYEEEVEILERSQKEIKIDNISGYWIKVKYNGHTGWLFSGYLIKDHPIVKKDKNQILNFYKILPNKYLRLGRNDRKKLITQNFNYINRYDEDRYIEFKGNINYNENLIKYSVWDSGPQGAAEIWVIKFYIREQKPVLVGITHRTGGLESIEIPGAMHRIHFLEFKNNNWEDITENILPKINITDFIIKEDKKEIFEREQEKQIFFDITTKEPFIKAYLTYGDSKTYFISNSILSNPIDLKWNDSLNKYEIIK